VFVSILMVEGFDPMAVRLALLARHYRADWEFTTSDLTIAERRLAVWRRAFAAPAGAAAEPVLAGMRDALRDDLDAPRALLLVDEWAASAGSGDPDAPAAVADAVDALLGVRLAPPADAPVELPVRMPR
ncbi:MAG: hypothetical protein REI45_03140, partial [Propionicimonas sp.]|nr:hypothetical protein [Propionicimonas sp.]